MKNNIEKKILPITGIGSVSSSDIGTAIKFSFLFDIPFLPQMTDLNESMIIQAKSGHYLANNNFSKIINDKNIKNFKIQIAGPTTSGQPVEILLNNIISLSEHYNQKPLVFIDEPVRTDDHRKLIILIDELKRIGFKVGIHSCNSFSLLEFLTFNINYLSIDSKFLNSIYDSKELKHFFIKKGKLILGILPEYENIDHIFIKHNIQSIILSPPCGLAGNTEFEMNNILAYLKNLRQSFIDKI